MKSDYILRFYADTPTGTNQRFSWRISSRAAASRRMTYFQAKGWKIRAAWLRNAVLCIDERIL